MKSSVNVGCDKKIKNTLANTVHTNVYFVCPVFAND